MSASRERLKAACELVSRRRREQRPASEIIAELVRDHGAKYDPRRDAARLRVAGVSSTCTWSKDAGLLENWRKTATLRLIMGAQEAQQ